MIAALTSFLLTGPIQTQQPNSKSDRGYIAAKFATKGGGITVYLPNDIAPGDMITGTVFVDSNADEHRDIQVQIGDVKGIKQNPRGSVLTWVVPTDARDGYPLIVTGKDGRQLGGARIPINPSPGQLDAFTFPNFVQTGRPAVIWGPFRGNSSKTKLQIKDSEVSILAESPRSMVFYVPYDTPVGPVTMSLMESSIKASTEIHAISIDLSTPRIDLVKDENAVVTLKVEGLAGLNEATVPYIRVQNMTPKIIDLAGQENHVVIPKVTKEGTFQQDFKAKCLVTGSFLITTFVEPGQGIPILPKKIG